MHPILRNVLAIVVGWAVGSAVNMGLIKVGHKVIPIDGVNMDDVEAMAQVMPTLDFQYFIFPFLGHAIGALIGALVAGFIAANNKMKFALAIGILFLLGGIVVNIMIKGPLWFTIVDIALAYIPMALIGGKIAQSFSKK